MLPTALGGLINLIIFGFIAYLIKVKYYSNGKDKTLGYFMKYFFYMTVFMLIFVIPQIFMPQNSKALALGYIFGHRIFLVIAQAYLFVVFLKLWNKEKWIKPTFIIIYALGIVLLILNIIKISNPITLPSGVIDWNYHPLVGQLTGLFSMLIGLPPLIFFIIRIIKTTENHVRLRAALITLGLLITAIGGPLHDMVTTISLYRLADVMTLGGLIIVFGGVLYKIPVEAGKFQFTKTGELAVRVKSSPISS